MKHYCPICNKECEYRYIHTIRDRLGRVVEVYQCTVCFAYRRVVVG